MSPWCVQGEMPSPPQRGARERELREARDQLRDQMGEWVGACVDPASGFLSETLHMDTGSSMSSEFPNPELIESRFFPISNG